MRPKSESGFTRGIARYAFENLDLPPERWSSPLRRSSAPEFFR